MAKNVISCQYTCYTILQFDISLIIKTLYVERFLIFLPSLVSSKKVLTFAVPILGARKNISHFN
jgi:hypothetical protein